MKKIGKDRLRLGFGLLVVLIPVAIVVAFLVSFALQYLVGPGKWQPLNPDDYNYVVLDNSVALGGEEADSFIQLINEQATDQSPRFPKPSGRQHYITLFSDDHPHGQTLFFSEGENLLSSSPTFHKRSVCHACGEALGAQINAYLSQPQQLLPEADQLISVTVTGREDNTTQLDAALYAPLLELLAGIYRDAEPLTMPVNLHRAWDFELTLNRPDYPELTVAQYTFPSNTFLRISIPLIHRNFVPDAGTIFRLPAGYDLFAELGLAP